MNIRRWHGKRPNHTPKCSVCGKFIPYQELLEDKASARLITPLSEVSKEEIEFLCVDHAK